MTILLAMLLAAGSAIACHAASPHCPWRVLHGRPGVMRGAAGLLALLSLAAWSNPLGIAAGLCAMLTSTMLVLIALPWLALSTGTPGTDTTEAD